MIKPFKSISCLSVTYFKNWSFSSSQKNNNKSFYFFFRTKWKRQTSVGFELLVEAGNYAAYQRAYRNYPQLDAWQYPGGMLPAGAAPGTPSAAELYYRQASLAALQGHPAYGMYPGAAAAAAAAAALSLPKPAFSMFQSPVSAAPPTTTTSATPTQLNQYYQNIQRLPLISSNRHSVSPPPPPPPPPPSDNNLTKDGSDSDDDDEHIEV